MKVGFVATEIGRQEGGAYMGGNVNNVVTVSRALADRGHEVAIITTTPRDAAPDPTGGMDWADVYEFTPRFEHGTPGYFASFCAAATRTAARLRRRGDLDVLTTHAGFTLWGAIGSTVGTVTDCPVVHVQYCPIEEPSGSRLYDALQRPWFTRRYLAGVDELVGISPVVSRSLERVTGRASVPTILPAIDTEAYAPVAAAERPDVPTITYLGSLKRQKGLDLLVAAFERLREDRDCRLRLGLEVRSARSEGPLAERIRADPDIEVNGIVEDVPDFLARSHAFAVPFRTTMGPADYPVAALEAMSCGVPIVATDVGGLGQLVAASDGGICVGPPTARNLETGLSELLGDEADREAYAGRAREYIERTASASVVAEQLQSVLESAIA